MTHEVGDKKHLGHFQNKIEDKGDGLMVLDSRSHKDSSNSMDIGKDNMADQTEELAFSPLSPSSSFSSASMVESSKISFSPGDDHDDCSDSSRHGDVVTGKNTSHHHLLYHSSYKNSSAPNPPALSQQDETPSASSSSSNMEISKMDNATSDNIRYAIRQRKRNQNIYSNCSQLRFGPKGTLLDNTKRLHWSGSPRSLAFFNL